MLLTVLKAHCATSPKTDQPGHQAVERGNYGRHQSQVQHR